ncbi:MAG: NAD-dependent epimerase/dehydratase family protein [Butyrivibrio sp.]|nr:NAD-dependent epimerase/dehydratase family protein [Butyrivibrio sp.]
MKLYENNLYIEDVNYVSSLNLPWKMLAGKSVLISGATGLIGSFLIDVLMNRNRKGLNCSVFASSRNIKDNRDRFSEWLDDPLLHFIKHDIREPLTYPETDHMDFVLHLASNTHPIQYATDPIGTITTNIYGLKNMLDFACDHHAIRFAFASSNEIYGENRGDTELFNESYCGYIDCNTLRAGYPESKRCGEALCQAYKVQKGLDVVIPRFTRSYGPSMRMTDTKAISQFIIKALAGEDIVLKSSGKQHYSYSYVADSVSGLLYILLCGKNGEAYNIADEASDITLKDLTAIIAEISGQKVIRENPEAVEAAGYSKATKARLDGSKLRGLGWIAKYPIKNGLERTLSILKSNSAFFT